MDHMEAFEVLDALHAAWSDGRLDDLSNLLTEDFEYLCNAGLADGNPLSLKGRDSFMRFWLPLRKQIDTTTVPETFKMLGDVARLHVQSWIRHKPTGYELRGSYRQIATFRDGRICAIEEYHDAAKLMAFWALIAHDDSHSM